MKKVIMILLALVILLGCKPQQTNNLPQTFNCPPKITAEKVETKNGTPLFIDEAKKIFIVKEGIGAFAKIKFGRSLDSLKTVLTGDGKLFVNPFDEKIMYLSAIDGVYLSENGGKKWEKILERETKIVSMGFNYNGDILAVLNYFSPTKAGYFISKIESKRDFIESQIDGNNDWLRSSNVFVFNPKDTQQIVVGGLLSKDDGKTFSKMKENLDLGEAVSIDPYDYNKFYTGRSDYSGIFIQDIDPESSYTKQIYPVNPVITYEIFMDFYTDIHHKITYAVDNYNTLFAIIDRKVYKIAEVNIDTSLKMEFIYGDEGIFYLLPEKGDFYYRVKILGEDKENKNIGVVESNEENIPKVSKEVDISALKKEVFHLSGSNVDPIAFSKDSILFMEFSLSGRNEYVTNELLEIYETKTGKTETIAKGENGSIDFYNDGQINDSWVIYETFSLEERETKNLKIWAFKRKSKTKNVILTEEDFKKIFEDKLIKDCSISNIYVIPFLLDNSAYIAMNATVMETDMFYRTKIVAFLPLVFKIDLETNEKEVIFNESTAQPDNRIITSISGNSNYIVFSDTGKDDEIVYLYSIKNKKLVNLLQTNGYDATITFDNCLIFEKDGEVVIAPLEDLIKRTPITAGTSHFMGVASEDYIAYYPDSQDIDVFRSTEVYNRKIGIKTRIKNCFFTHAYIEGDALTIFGCNFNDYNHFYQINLKENGL